MTEFTAEVSSTVTVSPSILVIGFYSKLDTKADDKCFVTSQVTKDIEKTIT